MSEHPALFAIFNRETGHYRSSHVDRSEASRVVDHWKPFDPSSAHQGIPYYIVEYRPHAAEPDPRIAALTAQVATLKGDREELLTALDALADEFECQVCEDGDELGKDDLAAARALVRRVRGGK